ncbi:unnamed protein product [Ectocarpus sp. 8 AP-2014]
MHIMSQTRSFVGLYRIPVCSHHPDVGICARQPLEYSLHQQSRHVAFLPQHARFLINMSRDVPGVLQTHRRVLIPTLRKKIRKLGRMLSVSRRRLVYIDRL